MNNSRRECYDRMAKKGKTDVDVSSTSESSSEDSSVEESVDGMDSDGREFWDEWEWDEDGENIRPRGYEAQEEWAGRCLEEMDRLKEKRLRKEGGT